MLSKRASKIFKVGDIITLKNRDFTFLNNEKNFLGIYIDGQFYNINQIKFNKNDEGLDNFCYNEINYGICHLDEDGMCKNKKHPRKIFKEYNSDYINFDLMELNEHGDQIYCYYQFKSGDNGVNGCQTYKKGCKFDHSLIEEFNRCIEIKNVKKNERKMTISEETTEDVKLEKFNYTQKQINSK
jgi:hypothetical protein